MTEKKLTSLTRNKSLSYKDICSSLIEMKLLTIINVIGHRLVILTNSFSRKNRKPFIITKQWDSCLLTKKAPCTQQRQNNVTWHCDTSFHVDDDDVVIIIVVLFIGQLKCKVSSCWCYNQYFLHMQMSFLPGECPLAHSAYVQ